MEALQEEKWDNISWFTFQQNKTLENVHSSFVVLLYNIQISVKCWMLFHDMIFLPVLYAHMDARVSEVGMVGIFTWSLLDFYFIPLLFLPTAATKTPGEILLSF